MPFGIDKLGRKVETLENTTGKLDDSLTSMSTELSELRSETIRLADQLKNLTVSVDKLAHVFETQIKTLNESLQALGKNLTQNVVENILSLPKIVPDFLKKKRDRET